jgi:(S)-ureidoglycine aminohydrolase
MNELFGFSRATITSRYALLTPDGFVPSRLPGWADRVAVVPISPALGAGFSQLHITLGKSGVGQGNTGRLEYFVYVLEGKCAAQIAGRKIKLAAGGFAFIPPETDFYFGASVPGTQLLIFQKAFEPLTAAKQPPVVVGRENEIPGRPFLGNDGARLQVLLPDELEFDLAVNIFTYQPGATLPFVETHIMEHGLLMLQGQGIYRLDADWHPVRAGDVIWMAPFCPQWFVAMGKSPASYIYYKNVNRPPLGQ